MEGMKILFIYFFISTSDISAIEQYTDIQFWNVITYFKQ